MKFVVSTGELLAQLTAAELALARHYLSACAERLAENQEPTKRYVWAFRRAEHQSYVQRVEVREVASTMNPDELDLHRPYQSQLLRYASKFP